MAVDAPRSILITGCSSGIGEAAARRLRGRGWRVFATARKPADVERLADEGFEALQLDLADSASIRSAVATVLERTGGRLDALFNNGAYGQPGAVEDLTRDVLRDQLETNLLGTHELTCLVLSAMRAQGHGRIVQNSSILGFAALPYRGAYNCSKFALEGLTDTLRLELAGSGIHVSLIEPGPIATRFRDNAFAAYQRHIDAERSAHAQIYRYLVRRLRGEAGKTPFTLPADAVVDRLIHAIESPRPKARYYVTFPTHLFGVLKRILPTRWMDRVLLRSTASERRD
ncbi:MAG: SDR family oxidoreductase [Zoogloeaceae bacterium]|nr:SDR family oxidoreductase [Zoogloeaceae bacterium]